ncbi:MAG TPA: glycosyltransferase family 2 protein [Longilinea sp.]|nr:glycosyltransferase family 2 protein [Longilinea sp.]
MKITIVIPSYNQGQFIGRTIDSILNQGYANLELLVMDGGSSDDTLQILKSYGDRIAWQSAPDRGQTQAVNNGWKITTGQILGWVNSDDLLLPGALEKVAGYFETHPETNWLYGNCCYIDAADQTLGDYPVKHYDYDRLIKDLQNYVPQPAVFLRRSILDSIGFLNEDLHYVMDLDYWLRIGLKFPAIHLDSPLACLRLHQDAKSVSSYKRFSTELVSTVEALFARTDLPDSVRRLRLYSLARAHLLAADMNFWAGDSKSAAPFAWQSWKMRPYRLHKLYLYILLGKFGQKLARQQHSNPYELGLLK